MTEVLEAGNIESMIDYLEYLDSVSVSPALLADMINELWSEAAVILHVCLIPETVNPFTLLQTPLFS